jgi:zinc transport system substrate-binding protein
MHEILEDAPFDGASGRDAGAGRAGRLRRGEAGLDVVASFYPMADFAEKIGGDRVNVTTMVPSGAEPHDWEPRLRTS